MKLFINKRKSGFTLIELLVVISIISVLSAAVLSSLNSARGKTRDVRRRVDLRQIQTALELYYNTNFSYPPSAGWIGNCATYGSYTTTGAGGWVPNLAPTYISVLPLDPKANGAGGCYIYNSNGADYKLLAHQTMEFLCPVPSTDSMYDPARSGQCTITIYTPGAVGF